MNLPIYRAKSKENNSSYIEGLLISILKEVGLCVIRTNKDYLSGEVCYLDTLSIHFPDMIDSNENKIFASLQENGRGGDKTDCGKVMIFDSIETIPYFESWSSYTITGIQE